MNFFKVVGKIGKLAKLGWDNRDKLDDVLEVVKQIDDILRVIGKTRRNADGPIEYFPSL